MAATYPVPRELRTTTVLVADGVTATFGPYAFKIFDVADATMLTKRPGETKFAVEPLAAVTKTTADALSTFTVTPTALLPNGTQYIVLGQRLHQRSTDATKAGVFLPDEFEKELSKLGVVLQETTRDLGRALKAPPGTVAGQFTAGMIDQVAVHDGAGGLTFVPVTVTELQAILANPAFANEVAAIALAARDAAEGFAEQAEDTALGVTALILQINNNVVLAANYAGAASISAQAAAADAVQTNSDRVAIQSLIDAFAVGSVNVYASSAAGLAATSVGDYFFVTVAGGDPGVLQLYRHDSGPVATSLGYGLSAAAVTDLRDKLAAQSVLAETHKIGFQGALAAGTSSTSASAYAYGERAKRSGTIKRIGLYCLGAGSYTVAVQSRRQNGNAWDRINTANVTITGAGAHIKDCAVPIAKGDVPGAHFPASIAVATSSAPSGDAANFIGASTSVDVASFTDSTEVSTTHIHYYLEIEYDSDLADKAEAREVETARHEEQLKLLLRGQRAAAAGVQDAPVTGSDASAGHYVQADNDGDKTRFVDSVDLFPKTKAEPILSIVSITGDRITFKEYLKTLSVNGGAGVNVPINRTLAPGEYIGLSFFKQGGNSFTAGQTEGYKGFRYAAWTGLTGATTGDNFTGAYFDDAVPDASNTLQVRINQRVIENDSGAEAALLFAQASRPAKLGKQTEPDAGDGSTLSAVFMALKGTAPNGGIARRMKWWNAASTQIARWGLGRFNTGTGKWEISPGKDFGVRTVTGVGAKSFEIDGVRIDKGDAILFHSAFGGNIPISNEAYVGVDYAVSPGAAGSVDSFTPTATLFVTPDIQLEYDELPDNDGADWHTIDLNTCGRLAWVAQSHHRQTYGILGFSGPNLVQQLIDWTCANFAQGGAENVDLTEYLRDQSSLYGQPTASINPVIVINSVSQNDYMPESGKEFTISESIGWYRQIIQIEMAIGAQFIVNQTEALAMYGRNYATELAALSASLGVTFKDRHPYQMEVMPVPHPDWIQGQYVAEFGFHPGVRTIFPQVYFDWMNLQELPLPDTSFRLFRARDSVDASSIQNMVYADDPDAYHRMRKLKPIWMGERYFTDTTIYDQVFSNSTDPYTQIDDEQEVLRTGGTLNLGKDPVLEVIVDAIAPAIEAVELTLTDPTVQIWMRDALTDPGSAGGSSYNVVQVGTGTATLTDIYGKMGGDKFLFHFRNAGHTAITMGMPRFRWKGKPGKPTRYPAPAIIARGGEMLAQTHFNGLGPWVATGSITIGNSAVDTHYGMPAGYTNWVNVNASNFVSQPLTITADAARGRQALARALARYLPPVREDPGSLDPLSITADTCPFRRVYFETVDPDGVTLLAFGAGGVPTTGEVRTRHDARPPAGLMWHWVECPVWIPRGQDGLSLAVKSDVLTSGAEGVMQIAAVSCKWVEA